MSYDDPEEELLDQHLREAFSELELAPARRVWEGIEGRIGALPGASQPLLPLKLLLPAIALAGVAAGWLLPRPVPTVSPAKPAVALVASVQAARPTSAPAAIAPEVPAPASVINAAAPNSRRQFSTSPGHPAQRAEAVELMTPQLAALAAAAPSYAVMLRPAAAANASVSQEAGTPRDVAPAAMAPGAALPTETPKTEGQQGFHAEFRQPTHRRAEKGRSIRRQLSAVGQWVRHLASPRRVRTTGHPSF